LEQALDAVHITANKNMIPNDPRKPNETSGLRLGTPAVTTRGMLEDSMSIIGRCIADTLYQRRSPEEITADVLTLTQKYCQYL
jgi:glycine hydroxymethyltransferase